MANEQNLRPIRTESEAREKGRNGGIASGKARRDKKKILSCLDYLIKNKHMTEDGKKKTGAEIVSYALFQKAASGNIDAIKMVIDMVEPNASNEETEDLDAIEADVFGYPPKDGEDQ